MKRTTLLAVVVAAGSLSMVVAAYQPPSPAPTGPKVIDIEKLRDNLYVLTSSTPGNPATFSGGNVAVFITDGGVTLVDDKLAGWGQAVLDKVKSVTDKPVTRIINTHTHGDHTGSNQFFPASVDIIVQDNTAANMKKMDVFQEEANKNGLPDHTFKDKMSLLKGKDQIDLYYFGPAHTNGDAFVVFKNLRVMHAGDAFANKGQPLIDRNNGGSGVAYPDTLTKAAKGIKNVDTVINGHTTMTTTWQDFVDYGEFNRLYLAHARESMKAGKSPEEALKTLTLPEKFKGYNIAPGGRGGPGGNFAIIYEELKGPSGK
jgi:cyclase